MPWSDEVHQRHVQAIYRPLRPAGRFEPAKEPDNSDVAPVVAVAGILGSFIAWHRHRDQLKRSQLRRIPIVGPWLAGAVQRLSPGNKPRGPARRNAGNAAMRRAQQTAETQPQPQPSPPSQGNKRKNNKKKKR